MTTNGPWAVVTGASSGLGLAFAERILDGGTTGVVLVARNADTLEPIAASLRLRATAEVRVVAADLGTHEGREAVLDATAALDVGLFVAAAGFGTSGAFIDADLHDEREMLEVNCWAVLELTHAFARRFVAQKRGGIVLFSSLLAWQGTPYAAHYAASKAYVQTFAEALAVELRPHGVDVIACAPGPVRSGFAARARMEMGRASDPATVARVTLRRLGRVQTVVPDALSKFLTYSLAALPRPLRVRTMSRIMASMTARARTASPGHL